MKIKTINRGKAQDFPNAYAVLARSHGHLFLRHISTLSLYRIRTVVSRLRSRIRVLVYIRRPAQDAYSARGRPVGNG